MDSLWPVLVDAAIILAIAFGAWRGYKEGVLTSLANLLGLVISLWLAVKLYAGLADWFLKIWPVPNSLANIAAFFLLALLIDALVSMLVMLGARQVQPKWSEQQWWKIAGTVPGGLHNLILAGYLCSLVLSLPIDHPIKIAVRNSQLGPPLAGLINVVAPTQALVEPALNDLSQLFTVEPDSKDFVSLPFKVADPTVCAEVESDMLTLVNQERALAGVGEVVADEPLRQVGRAHSLDMFQRGYFSHYTPEGKDPFDRMDAAGIVYQEAGENLALAPTLQAAHTGLMNSPGHRKNILNGHFHKLGIGCYQSSRYGLMISQEFSN